MSMFGPTMSAPIMSSEDMTEAYVPNNFEEFDFEVLVAAEIVEEKNKTLDGCLIEASSDAWFSILQELNKNPELLSEFSQHPRKFEEFIATSYKNEGIWDDVVLTPRSGDGGRDIIAIKKGFGSLRFLEQTKAYNRGLLVTHDDVSAMLGVTQTDQNTSKVLVTTTSDFQPGIINSDRFKPLMPHRLELKNGTQLLDWLNIIASKNKT